MDSREAARLAFGNPGFFDFLAPIGHAVAQGFKAAAPVLSIGASFLPGGSIISKAIDYAAGAIADESSNVSQAIFPTADDAEDDSLGNDGDY
jgi:hypothetical protein